MPENEPDNQNFQSAFTDAAAAQAAAQSASAATPPATPPVEPVVTPAVTPAPTVAPPQQPTPSALAQAASRAGVRIEGLSDEQIATSMADLIVRNRPYATYGQQLAPYADQIRDYFSQQTQPTPPAAPAEDEADGWNPEKYFSEKWPAPKWDDTYNFAIQQGMVQRNAETGMFEPAPGYEQLVLELLPGLNRATTWTAQQWQGITRGNPYQQFYDVLREPLQHVWQEDIRSIIREQLDLQQTEQRVNRFEADNASWLYAVDPTGVQVLTTKGQTFYNEIAQLRERGISDPQTLIDLASRLVGVGFAPPTTAQGAAAAIPTVPAAAPDPRATSAAQTSSFLQNALERASHAPSAGGYTQVASDHPVIVNESDLNNMFVSAFRESQAGRV